MERTDRGYRLSSGREFSANAHLISIARHNDGRFEICNGYDGTQAGATGDDCDDEENWTFDERRELADFMIAQWTAFRDGLV